MTTRDLVSLPKTRLEIQELINKLQEELIVAKQRVIQDIQEMMEEHGISLKEISRTIHLPRGRKANPAPINRKGYCYHCKESNRWFTGYGKIPSWFVLEKADSYLVPGRTHSKPIQEALAKLVLTKVSPVMPAEEVITREAKEENIKAPVKAKNVKAKAKAKTKAKPKAKH